MVMDPREPILVEKIKRLRSDLKTLDLKPFDRIDKETDLKRCINLLTRLRNGQSIRDWGK